MANSGRTGQIQSFQKSLENVQRTLGTNKYDEGPILLQTRFLLIDYYNFVCGHILSSWLRINSEVITLKVARLQLVRNKQLDVLRVFGDQEVTAQKTFTSMRLLQEQKSGSSTFYERRRRSVPEKSDRGCEFLDEQELTEDTRREALLWGLRRVAAAQDLLTIFAKVSSDKLAVSQYSIPFYTKLAEDVACAFSQVDDGGIFLDLYNGEWNKTVNSSVLDFHVNITNVTENIHKYIDKVTKQLNGIHIGWHDIFMDFSDSKKNIIASDESLFILDLLILLFKNNQNGSETEECKLYCPEMYSHTSIHKRGENCRLVLSIVSRALKRIQRYPSIMGTMRQLSGSQARVLETVVVENNLGKLLDAIRKDGNFRGDLNASVRCGVSPEAQEELQGVLTMLRDYRKVLKEARDFSFSERNSATPDIPSTSAELTTSADLVRPFSTVSEAIASTEEVVVSFTPEQTTVSNVVGLTDFPINRSGLLGVNSRSSDAFWTVPGRKEEKVTIADTLKLLEELKILWQGMVQKSGKSSASRDVQETLISSGKVDAIIKHLEALYS
nr:uncharacterized protein LOC128687785 [Cherax quadricarinatus]